jgi:4-carboxymuconolactone decarboxylase
MAQDAREKGFSKRAELFGEAQLQRTWDYLNKFDEGFARLVNDQCFGEVWSRPGLPTRTRSMITMAALLVLGRAPELKIHMRGALNVGVTPDEIKELIIHLSQYGGIPVAVEAIRTFLEVTEPKSK